MGFQQTYAQTKANPITTAVPILRVSADARTAAMGDISAATTPDVNSLFYNIGKSAFNEKKYGVGITYTPWLSELDIKSIYLFSLASYYKLSENEAITFGTRYFSKGNLTAVDNLGQDISTYKPNDLSVEAGYSRKLSKNMGLGISLRYIHSKLADKSTYSDTKAGNTVAADLGFYYKTKKQWSFGAALTNLGGKLSYSSSSVKDYIPANLNLGAAYTKDINDDNKVSFGLDINKLLVPTPPDPNDAAAVAKYNNKGVVSSWFSSFCDAPGGGSEEIKEFQVGLGGEYTYKKQFSFRAGYFTESKDKGNRNYATVGAGVNYKMTELNLSYLVPTGTNTNTSALKNSLRVSLAYNFNN
jgi:hypothetical protein